MFLASIKVNSHIIVENTVWPELFLHLIPVIGCDKTSPIGKTRPNSRKLRFLLEVLESRLSSH